MFLKLTRFLFILSVLIVSGCSSLTSRGAYTVTRLTTEDADKAARLITAYRASKGLGPLTVDEKLNKAAMVQAQNVAKTGELEHGNFQGRLVDAGITLTAAENLAARTGSVERAIEEWKTSPGHNRNMLKPEVTRMGLARADSNAKYKDFWVLVVGH